MTLNIAHRGASVECPENTLAAFLRALQLGADYLELDLRFTRDGESAVIHDATVERTTSGRGAVSRMTLAEVRRLECGAHVSARFRGEKIPTLAEVIRLVQPHRAGLLVEIKPGRRLPESSLKHLLRLLDSSGLDSRVILQSFDHTVLERLKTLGSSMRTALLLDRPFTDPVPRGLPLEEAGIVSVKAKWLSPGVMARARNAGLQVFSWTVNSQAEIQRVLNLGVDGIISDYPDRVARVVDARHAARRP